MTYLFLWHEAQSICYMPCPLLCTGNKSMKKQLYVGNVRAYAIDCPQRCEHSDNRDYLLLRVFFNFTQNL